MKKLIVAGILSMTLMSCNSVFVWTVRDIIGLSLLGIAAILLSYCYIAIKIDEWRRRRGKKDR